MRHDEVQPKQALCKTFICGWAKGCVRPMTRAIPKVIATQSHRLSTATTSDSDCTAMDSQIDVSNGNDVEQASWRALVRPEPIRKQSQKGLSCNRYTTGSIYAQVYQQICLSISTAPRHRDQGCCSHLGAHLHPNVFAFGLSDAGGGCPVGHFFVSAGAPGCFRLLLRGHATNSCLHVPRVPLKGTTETQTQRSGVFAK